MADDTYTEPALTTQSGFEPINALSAVWAVAPRLAEKLTRMHNYAKAVQTYLRALDFYCQQNAVSPRKVRVETTVLDSRIVQRISG